MNKALSAIGIAEQKDAATGIAQPTYYVGVLGGKLVNFPISGSVDDITSGLDGESEYYRESVAVAFDASTRAYPKLLGLLLKLVFGGITTTGASAPYSHAFSAAGTIGWATVFGKFDNELRKAIGCRVDQIEFKWEGNKPLEVSVTLAGMTPGYPASITVPNTAEMTGSPYFTPVGGTFKIAASGASPAAAKLLSGRTALKRGVEADYISGTITPGDINHGILVVETQFDVRVADLLWERVILTGAENGSAATGVPVYGSFDHKFVIPQAATATELQFVGTRVPFETDPEEAGKAGPMTLSLKGNSLIPSGGTSPIAVTLKNDVAAYATPT